MNNLNLNTYRPLRSAFIFISEFCNLLLDNIFNVLLFGIKFGFSRWKLSKVDLNDKLDL